MLQALPAQNVSLTMWPITLGWTIFVTVAEVSTVGTLKACVGVHGGMAKMCQGIREMLSSSSTKNPR